MKNCLPLLFLAIILFSCHTKEEAPIPENVLQSDAGLKIQLLWDTGSSPEKAIEEADLDLFLLIGQDTAGESAWYDFEEIELKSFFADGFYTLQIDAFQIKKNTRYILQVSGGSDSSLQTFEGTFKAGDEHSVNFMEIQKTGTNYTLIQLPAGQQ